MGCSIGKFDNQKFKTTDIIDINDKKIQTVMQLPSKKCPQSRISNAEHMKCRPKRNDSGCKTMKHNRHKSPRPKNDKVVKSIYDSKITAKYDIKALIGKGSCSHVLRVEKRISKQPYALKIIEAPGGHETFEAELSVLRRLSHPNVVKLIEVFEANHKVYTIMELATGGSLLDRLESKGFLTEEESRDVIRMVINGVKYLHALGITHRDLKPDNLLYYHPGKDSKIMITDFSLASTRKPSGKPYMHTICGTPQYIAPDIVTRKPYTCAVDMWAMGVITYIVLCGAFPFDSDHDVQIFKLILRGQVEMSDSIWCDVSTEGKSFVKQLLHTDPNKRLDATAALFHDWLTLKRLTYSPIRNGGTIYNRSDRRSMRSSRSIESSMSGSSSGQSLRSSGHRRVQLHLLEALSSDPEVAAMM